MKNSQYVNALKVVFVGASFLLSTIEQSNAMKLARWASSKSNKRNNKGTAGVRKPAKLAPVKPEQPVQVDDSRRRALMWLEIDRKRVEEENLERKEEEKKRKSWSSAAKRSFCGAAWSGNLDLVKSMINDGTADADLEEDDGGTPLHYAAKSWNLEMVKFLVNRDIEIIRERNQLWGNYRNDYEPFVQMENNNHETPLHFAAKSRNLEIAQFLVDQGAHVNAVTLEGQTPLHFAARSGDLQLVKFLMKQGAGVNAIADGNKTSLHFAARSGNSQLVGFLIEQQGADVNACDIDGRTPLHFAARSGDLETVKLLIAHGANVNAIANGNMTLLHFAARSGNLQLVRFLINQQGADVNAIADGNKTLLHFAAKSRNSQLVKNFIKRKAIVANINARDINGRTPLYFAAKSGSSEIVNLLIKHEAEISEVDNFGETVLHGAVESGNLTLVKALISTKRFTKAIRKPDYRGYTLSHFAARAGRTDILEFLIGQGYVTDINAITTEGCTLLHCAVESNFLGIVKFLVDRKANINASNGKWYTPLALADEYGYTLISEFLRNPSPKR
ncbi:MAG: ankyrin repeat domain-containing protein [Holosporaceae bacterium]|jgi:ankyrin repeat protein|nr:ankyrin repeat domain-containing protein [Holosporaceae bacterium]